MRQYKGIRCGMKVHVRIPDELIRAGELESLKRGLYKICEECGISHAENGNAGTPGDTAHGPEGCESPSRGVQ